MLSLLIYRILFIIFDILSSNNYSTNGFILRLPLNVSNLSTSQLINQSLYTEDLTINNTNFFNQSILVNIYQNQTEEAEEELFVKDSAGVWVISVMSGTCILTIAFIVRGLFSRAEAFHDGTENHHGTDINGGLIGGNGFASGGADMGFLTTNMV
ncbi:unnamed protein product [Schistosoma rodhaini]|uniref:Legume lectin domain-containing protein n=1 Tax=Schistosoma rodhaini TaxID=6188 RepID=A0AA85ENL9_9TREM|nr:unnamed protein product [Schistosoma rodhaini]